MAKEIIPRTFTDEEMTFIRKYSEDILYCWERMTDSQKKEYKELEKYYSDFANLFSEHYEDLKLYSLMYRNVPLYNCNNDPISILFFSSRKDEIVGFKDKLLTDHMSDKAKVVFLYYNNEALFPKAVKKHIGIDIKPQNYTKYAINRSILNDFKSGKFDQGIGVYYIDDEKCKEILANKRKLEKDYEILYQECEELFLKVQHDEEFYIKYFLNDILKERMSSTSKRIMRYIIHKCGDKVLEEIKTLRNKKYEYDSFYNELYEKLRENKRNIEDLKKNGVDTSFYNYSNIFTPEQKAKSLELDRKIHEDKIRKLEDKCHSIERETKDRYESLVTLIKESITWQYFYSHYNEIQQYVTESYERLYNFLWIRKPDYIRKIESQTTSAYFKREILNSNHLKLGPIIRYVILKKTKGVKFVYDERVLMRIWCSIISKENEEKERIKREKEILMFQEQERRRKIEEEKKMEKFRFNQRNIHYRDSHIFFERTEHKYIVNGEVLQSVTNFVKDLFPIFDAEIHAQRLSVRMGKTTKEILDMWETKGKESRDLGILLHQKIENYYQGVNQIEDDTFRLFKEFAEKIKLEPYRTEWTIYDWKHKIAGTVDLVDYQNGEYIIYDWKRSDKIIVNDMPIKTSLYNEKANYPLQHIDNSPYYHYALQLSLYKYILENNYDIKIADLRLGVFHPSYKKPYVIRMPYLEKELDLIFNLRAEVIF